MIKSEINVVKESGRHSIQDKTRALHRRLRTLENVGRNGASILRDRFGYGEGSWERKPVINSWEKERI